MRAASKKATILVAVFCLMGCLALVACSSSDSESSDGTTTVEYSEDSLIAYHEALGTDISDLTEVSVDSCTGSGCHGGSYDSVREETEGYWEGVGQITDANPHNSHASSAFVCENCHSLTGTSVNMCNQCHDFESPDTWTDKDYGTTQYGIVSEAPLY